MKAQEFVDAVRKVVVDATGPSIVSILQSPPGRRPSAELADLSRWYSGLSDDDRTMVERLLALAVRHSVFGVFEVIDGALKLDPTAASGDHFELRHVHRGGMDVISGPQGDPLHELLQLLPPHVGREADVLRPLAMSLACTSFPAPYCTYGPTIVVALLLLIGCGGQSDWGPDREALFRFATEGSVQREHRCSEVRDAEFSVHTFMTKAQAEGARERIANADLEEVRACLAEVGAYNECFAEVPCDSRGVVPAYVLGGRRAPFACGEVGPFAGPLPQTLAACQSMLPVALPQ